MFRLRDKRRASVLLTDLQRVLVLPRRDGSVLMLSLQRPEALLQALRRADALRRRADRPARMHPSDWRLINGDRLDAIPARLARARGNATARALAGADWLLRRKADGRFLAVRRGDRLQPLWRGALRGAWTANSSAGAGRPRRRSAAPAARTAAAPARTRPRRGQYARDTGSSWCPSRPPSPSPASTAIAARCGCARRAQAWQAMRAPRARRRRAGAISGYRSHDYQLGIFRRKLARGQTVAEDPARQRRAGLLRTPRRPGARHLHAGRAAAEESFEDTPAFAWLQRSAGDFGFVMSYPRGNPHGIDYEPWHWRWRNARRLVLRALHLRFGPRGAFASLSESATRHRYSPASVR
jgi:D-alanyl-D-alanine carboxypeptidase